MKTNSSVRLSLLLAALSLLPAIVAPGATDSPVIDQVREYPLFIDRLEWVGPREPTRADCADLLRVMKTVGPGDIASLDAYITEHPRSPWLPSLCVNLAEVYATSGRYSLALVRYEAAWNATRGCKDSSGRRIAAQSVAGLASLLANLGQKEKLEVLLKEINSSQIPLGIYGPEVTAAENQLRTMQLRPGDAFKCGLLALTSLAKALQVETTLQRYWLHTASPDGGFTLAQLLSLAQTNGLQLEAVRRPSGADLVVPCIVHWKFNHYALITAAEEGRYQVVDSTAERSVVMTATAIAAESSGVFLLPREKVPTGWQKIGSTECGEIRGGCYGGPPNDADDCDPDCDGGDEGSCSDPCDPPSANDGASGDGDDPCSPDGDAGMPRWRVSEPYINLWLHDTPLRYRLSSGQWMPLKLSYKQRFTAENWYSRFPSFGKNWSCNWIGFVNRDFSGSYKNHMAGGGARVFRFNIKDYLSARTMCPILGVSSAASSGGGAFWTSMGLYPVIKSPLGSENTYSSALQTPFGTTYFLTQRVDRYGRKTYYDYTAYGYSTRLTTVRDVDGRTITLAYEDPRPGFEYMITSVTDPYNRTCHFAYDSDFRLTNIVDTIGMSTSFKYDQNNVVTNMITPYGTNSFRSFAGNGRQRSDNPASYSENRALLVTEANGKKQLYAFCAEGPWDYCGGDGESQYRNSYHWNRAQFALIPSPNLTNVLNLPDTDYYLASIKHWIHADASMGAVCDTASSMAGPVDSSLPGYLQRSGIRSFWYQGQTGANFPGTLKRVTTIWDASWQPYIDVTRNANGRPLIITYYNSDGSTASYTNHYDVSGTYLQKQYGPNGELVRGYGYANPLHANLLTSVTNALGEVIRYTHDPATLHVTSITFASGLVRTNVYYTSGLNRSFLQMQADIGFRTNYFTYLNGNLCVHTNELGLVTTNTWDALNRLTSTKYPDGTTISNLYDKLDIVGVKDRLNNWTRYGYNAVRQMEAITNANEQVTLVGYCDCGSPESINRLKGSGSVSTFFTYDVAGRLTNTVYADDYYINRTYDENDLLQTVCDSGGRKVSLDYARHGLRSELAHAYMISDLSGPQLLISQVFDEYGRVTNSIDRNGVITGFSYDLLDRVRFRLNYGNSRQVVAGAVLFNYNARGLTNYLDPAGQLTTFVRDASGRELFITNANQEVLRFTYDGADDLLSLTDGKVQTTRWKYDCYGQVTNKLDANNEEMFRYQYDPNGRLTNRWQAGDVVTTYRYDALGNLTNVDYPASHDLSFQYDALNRLTNMVDGIGTTAFTWTDGDQLASEAGPWSSDTVSYTHDNRLRSGLSLQHPTTAPWTQSYLYDEFGRLTNVTSAAGLFGYEYENRFTDSGATVADLVRKLSFPTGGFTMGLYDDVGRLFFSTLVGPWGIISDLHGYRYNSASQCTQQVFRAANYVNYSYDNIGQLKIAKGFEPNCLLRSNQKRGYAYDAAGNLNWRTNNNLVLNFQVNNLNELTGVSRPANSLLTVAGAVSRLATNVTVGGQSAQIYGDDTFALEDVSLADGDNTFTAQGYAADGDQASTSLTVNLPSTASYTYDDRGNLTSDGMRAFAYDDENQLTSVTVSGAWRSEFEYDGMLRRRKKLDRAWNGSTWTTTNEVHYVYDGRVVIQERNASNVPQVTYTRGNDLSGTLEGAGGIGGLLARTDNPQMTVGNPSAHAFYHSDGNGNITCMFTPDGSTVARYSYDPFGNITTMSGTLAAANRYRFSSKEYHPNSGLVYYLYRYYDPNLQRWLNRDPIEEEGGINLYTFVWNHVANSVDLFGLCGAASQGAANFLDAEIYGPQKFTQAVAGGIVWATDKADESIARMRRSKNPAIRGVGTGLLVASIMWGGPERRASKEAVMALKLATAFEKRAKALKELQVVEEVVMPKMAAVEETEKALVRAGVKFGQGSTEVERAAVAHEEALAELSPYKSALKKARENWQKANEEVKNCR